MPQHPVPDEPLDLDLTLANRQARTRFFVDRALRSSPPKPIRQLSPRGVYVPQPSVEARGAVVKVWTAKATTTAAHSRYLSRGKGLDGADAPLFGPMDQPVDRQAFVARAQADSHQFRLIVSLVPPVVLSWVTLTQHFMAQVSHDVRSSLDWLGAVHHDTLYTHVHVAWRAALDDGRPLYLSKDYYQHGLRFQVQAMATRLLGRLTPAQVDRERRLLPMIAADVVETTLTHPRVLSPALVTQRLADTEAQVQRFKAHVQRVQQRHVARHPQQQGRRD